MGQFRYKGRKVEIIKMGHNHYSFLIATPPVDSGPSIIDEGSVVAKNMDDAIKKVKILINTTRSIGKVK